MRPRICEISGVLRMSRLYEMIAKENQCSTIDSTKGDSYVPDSVQLAVSK